LAINVAFNLRFDPAVIVSQSFVISNILSIVGVLVTSEILFRALQTISETAAIKEHARMIETQLSLQKTQYERVTKNAEHEKTVRHNLRHQLVAISGYNAAGDNESLRAYLETLMGELPDHEILYCKNYAVNAVINYYLSIAKSEGVRLDVKLDIPEKAGSISDMELCVIMGNFLENAVEANRRIEREEKFIRVRSRIQGEYLTIAVENTFDGICNKKDGAYFSHKRENNTEGIGLPSVNAICTKYGGRTVISIEGKTWHSTAVVIMHSTQK
jgi:sensor histidine kinase regulating citrate/malate metabolism